jgi:DUF438 domain-containing protein
MGQGNMTIPDTSVTIEELLDRIPLAVQYVDKDGFLRYMNKVAAARPAKIKREVGINIRNCHAKPESLEMIERIFEDFKQGRKEPHYYVTSGIRKTIMVPVFDAGDNFIGVLSCIHPLGLPEPDRTF